MPDSIPSSVLNNTLAIVMGGGRGTRLFPLTHRRSKPAVPLAGKYRLVDIPISNCINSEIRHVYVLTQFNTESLHRHIGEAYKFDHFGGDFVHILAAQQTPSDEQWYQGTADAVRKNLSYFQQRPYDYYLILSGDQLYRMDFRSMLAQHIATKSDVTIATTPVDREPARSFGIMDTDDDGRICRFAEKPGDDDKALDALKMPEGLLKKCGIPVEEERFQASMGIYLFNRKVMEDCLDNDQEDFGRDIIPASIEKYRVFSYVFQDYWEDIGTIKAFFEANLALTRMVPSFNFFDPDNTIYSRARFLPASKINEATIKEALISDGCIITHASIQRSIIGIRSVIEAGCQIEDSIIMGADYYNRKTYNDAGEQETAAIMIGANSTIRQAIIDKNVTIGSGVSIEPRGRKDGDYEYCYIRDGIVVVPKSTSIPDGTQV